MDLITVLIVIALVGNAVITGSFCAYLIKSGESTLSAVLGALVWPLLLLFILLECFWPFDTNAK